MYRLKSRVKVSGWTWLGNEDEDNNFDTKDEMLVVVFTWLEGKYFMLRFMRKRKTSNVSSIYRVFLAVPRQLYRLPCN